MKRVLMTGDTVGGVWTFTLDLAEALGRHGVEVVLAALGAFASDAQRAEARRIPNLRLLESNYRLEWMEDPWEDVRRSGEWLLEVEQSVAPDVVHLNSYGHGALAWSAPVLLTGHSCVMSWWRAVKREAAPASWSRYREEVARSLRAAAIVTAPSRAMLAALEANYGPLPHGRVILNGRDPARFCCRPKEEAILCAGRLWDEGKNVAALAQIAAELPWPVYVAGEAGSRAIPGCRPLGRLPAASLAAWYARAAIYALPARYEPFGLSALEAALSGCALVLGNLPSLREVWQDAAIYVPPDDPLALRDALRALIEDTPLRTALAEWACERARQFTAEQMAQQYLAVYRELAAGARVLCA